MLIAPDFTGGVISRSQLETLGSLRHGFSESSGATSSQWKKAAGVKDSTFYEHQKLLNTRAVVTRVAASIAVGIVELPRIEVAGISIAEVANTVSITVRLVHISVRWAVVAVVSDLVAIPVDLAGITV